VAGAETQAAEAALTSIAFQFFLTSYPISPRSSLIALLPS